MWASELTSWPRLCIKPSLQGTLILQIQAYCQSVGCSQNEVRIKALICQILTKRLATGGQRGQISSTLLPPPGLAWDQAFGANVQLHLESMVHWLATVPGAASCDICRYI